MNSFQDGQDGVPLLGRMMPWGGVKSGLPGEFKSLKDINSNNATVEEFFS